MNIYLTHDSAREYWVGPYAKRRDKTLRLETLPSKPLLTDSINLDTLPYLGIKTAPVHTSVGNSAHRSRQPDVISHLITGPLPAGSFERLKGDFWVASPELCFCQMANKLTFAEEVRLGYELCARFQRNDFTEDLDAREPLSSEVALRSYTRRCTGMPGHRAATHAAQYVTEHAESPMEIAVAMLLTLPRHYGGYGLPHAVLNPELLVSRRSDKRVKHTYRPDLAWPEQRLIVEYDSNLHHQMKADVIADAQRRNALQDAGWRVVALTWDQVRHPQLMDEAAAQLAHALGIRLPKTTLEQDFRRKELRTSVFSWATKLHRLPF